jgi:hypothetical protein
MANTILLKFQDKGKTPSNTSASDKGDISKVCGFVNPLPDAQGNCTPLLTTPLMLRNCIWYSCEGKLYSRFKQLIRFFFSHLFYFVLVSEWHDGDDNSDGRWVPILTEIESLDFILADNILEPSSWNEHIFVRASERPIWGPNDFFFVEGSSELQTHTEDCHGSTLGMGGKPASRNLGKFFFLICNKQLFGIFDCSILYLSFFSFVVGKEKYSVKKRDLFQKYQDAPR